MKKCYIVTTVFTLHGTFFVYARNAAEARNLICDKCYRQHPSAHSKTKGFGWEFSLCTNFKWVGLAELVPSKSQGKKKCYTVPATFTDKGLFWTDAKNANEARKLVEENCGQRHYSKIWTKLQADKISWKFARKPMMTTDEVRYDYHPN